MSRLERFVGSALVSADRLQFLTEPYITFGAVTLSRRELAEYEVISPAAMTRLIRVLDQFGVTTVSRLHQVGLSSLAKCEGIGEACLWAASVLLEAGDADVQSWIDAPHSLSFERAIEQAATRRRKRGKDPAPAKHARSKARRRPRGGNSDAARAI